MHSLKKDHKEFIKSKLMLKVPQRLKSERHNIFTKQINKIALSSNDDKRVQSIDWIEIHAYRIYAYGISGQIFGLISSFLSN